MSLPDNLKSQKLDKKQVEKARSELAEVKQAAKEQLATMPTLTQFEMAGECKDKNGELTRVFEIDTDAAGVLGLFLEVGPPFSFVMEANVAPDDRVKKDTAKFNRYFDAMANVDILDGDNLKAIGWDALAAARETVEGFFMLRLVSATNLGATES